MLPRVRFFLRAFVMCAFPWVDVRHHVRLDVRHHVRFYVRRHVHFDVCVCVCVDSWLKRPHGRALSIESHALQSAPRHPLLRGARGASHRGANLSTRIAQDSPRSEIEGRR